MLHKGNYNRFRSFLPGIPWTVVLKDCDAIDFWEILKSKMQEGMDTFISKQSAGYVTIKPLWMIHRAFSATNKKYFYWKKIKKASYMLII